MIAFLIRRIVALTLLLFGITLLVFLLMYLAPGDFLDEARASRDISAERIAQMEKEFGLNQPWYVQFGKWLGNVARLNFGESWSYKVPVIDLLKQRLPETVILALTSLAFAWLIAVPLGVLAAIYKDSIFDRLSAVLAYAALSIPEFFLAMLAVNFAATTGWFPTGGSTSLIYDFLPFGGQLFDRIHHLILPTVVLGLGGVAGMMRIMRANFLDYMRAEFVTTARAKGLRERVVMFRHVLRNAINPLITAFGFAFSSLLSGALLVENVMNYPGLGKLIFEAFMRQDQYVVMAAVVVGCVMLTLGNLLADILLAWSDPRIRLEDTTTTSHRRVLDGTPMRTRLAWTALVAVPVLVALLAPWNDAGFTSAVLANLRTPLIWITLGGAAIVLLFLARYLIPAMIRLLPALFRRPLALGAFLVLAVFYAGAIFAPFLAPYRSGEQNLEKGYHPPTALVWRDGTLQAQVYELVDPLQLEWRPVEGETIPLRWFAKGPEYRLFGMIPTTCHLFQPDTDDPSQRVYLLGSDELGRDIFSRLLFGAQISLSIGFIGISITFVMGFLVGALSGYFGGKIDFFAMRCVEFLMAIPGLYLLLALRSALSPHFESGQMFILIVIILSFIGWAGTARVLRGMTLSIANRQFVLAAETMGQSTFRILSKHILPSLTSYLLVAATISVPGYILGEAALSFLGLGIQDPSASWGLMLSQAQDMKVFMLNLWWMLIPGVAIFLTVVSFNLLGDALRDIVDPKMKV